MKHKYKQKKIKGIRITEKIEGKKETAQKIFRVV